MQHFRLFSKSDILSLTRIRKFETKLGERIRFITNNAAWQDELKNSAAGYVLIGIPEDIGVRANLGRGGADTAWIPFLSAFLNIQSNDFLIGEELLLLGNFDFGDIKYLIDHNAGNNEEKLEAYRHAVNTIDADVESIVQKVVEAGKIPIIIGGGHNNAYPIIKAAAKGLLKNGTLPRARINCINLDAQSDLRPAEGRHSGNAFRYAMEDGYLDKYYVVGLHENYIQQSVLSDIMKNPSIRYTSYEDIFIHEKLNFLQAVAHAAGFTENTYTGIELDLDSIQDTLSSALTPSGISALMARKYVNYTATDCKVSYLHIAEGACRLSDGTRDDSTGKLISYLVADFIKAHAAG